MAKRKIENPRSFQVNDALWAELSAVAKHIGSNNSAIIRGLIRQFVDGVKETGGTPEFIPAERLPSALRVEKPSDRTTAPAGDLFE